MGPANYHDEYRKKVEDLIEEKRQGKAIVVERAASEPTPVVDLMEALQASVEAARTHRAGTRLSDVVGERPARAAKRAPARVERGGGPLRPREV